MKLNVTNNTLETVTFDRKEMIGVLDLRSLGYCKIEQGALQQNLSKHYHFETADTVCNQFNKICKHAEERKGRMQRKIPLVLQK